METPFGLRIENGKRGLRDNWRWADTLKGDLKLAQSYGRWRKDLLKRSCELTQDRHAWAAGSIHPGWLSIRKDLAYYAPAEHLENTANINRQSKTLHASYIVPLLIPEWPKSNKWPDIPIWLCDFTCFSETINKKIYESKSTCLNALQVCGKLKKL